MKLEKSIITGCQNGDRKAQDVLIHEYAEVLMAICMRYTKDTQKAKDALQETFINVLKYIHTYNFSGSFDGWIKRIAVNSALRTIKQLKHTFEKELKYSCNIEQSSIPDVYGKLYKEDLMKLLSLLPDSMYTVFNLSVIEGYSHKEIGELLNMSEQNSRIVLFRARQKIVEILKENKNDFIHQSIIGTKV